MIYMANEQQQITNFELPRPDWHDDKGRIYKDALIENFNAIEAKLTDIAELSAVSTDIPDISGVTFEDVTLGSDDEMVVNLRPQASVCVMTFCTSLGVLDIMLLGTKTKERTNIHLEFVTM